MSEAAASQDAETIVRILRKRDGRPTEVVLCSGARCMVWNIAWGLDPGDTEYHITSNISPFPGDESAIHFFFTDEVQELRDPEAGSFIFERRGPKAEGKHARVR